MIYCGTTPTHEFELPLDTSLLKTVKVSYYSTSNDNVPILQKRTEDCELSGNILKIHLTQQDTFKFNKTTNVKIVIRGLDYSGEVFMAEDIFTTAKHCLDTEVLV